MKTMLANDENAAQDLMALRRDWEQKTQELLMLLGK
jgi:hypothetical protein